LPFKCNRRKGERKIMKSKSFLRIFAMILVVAHAIPIRADAQNQQAPNTKQIRYAVINLGTLGGTQGGANTVTNNGWVMGWANLSGDQNEHAVLWRGATKTDLGTLGGPNSASSWPVKNEYGVVAGNSQTSETDPFGENFCTFGTYTTYLCQGFRWQDGKMTALPTLGGNNSWATVVNHRGQVAGIAETRAQDPNCIPPQVFDFEAVVWGPSAGEIQAFLPLPGDAVSVALGVNDRGQVVGGSGICGMITAANSVHAVLWEHNSVTDLGSFGGVLNNAAIFINNRGEVVGISDLAGDATFHAFLWTKDNGLRDLGTLSGDVLSLANSINEQGQVVGESCDQNGNCRGILWQDGVMTDINSLVLPGSILYLVNISDINDRGEIAGYAYDPTTGEAPGFLAIPCDAAHAEVEGCMGQPGGASVAADQTSGAPKMTLPENVRKLLQQKRGFGRF
jgi:probable HAF family extracellular repeat protein